MRTDSERLDEARIEIEWQEWWMLDAGLLDPGQPTPAAHIRYNEAIEAPFTRLERRCIRAALFGSAIDADDGGRDANG